MGRIKAKKNKSKKQVSQFEEIVYNVWLSPTRQIYFVGSVVIYVLFKQ